MKKLIFLFTLSLLLVSMAWGQTTIHYNECSSATSGWTFTNGGGQAIQQGGYWLVDNSGDAIISEAFDVSGYVNLTLDFRVATYSSGTNHPAKVEYSTDNGATWNASTFTSATPTSSSYINSGTWNIGTISSSQFKLKWTHPTGSLKGVRIDDISFKGTVSAGTPVITVTPSSLTGFTYSYANGPSAANSFTVTGSSLTGNLSVSSSGTDYVVSATEGGTYGSSLTLTQSGGSVSATVYIKLNAGLAIGTYNNQNITVSGGGATSTTVSCSGEVTSPPPPGAPTATVATNVDDDSFTANWNSVSGATGYYLDVYKMEAGGNATDLFISEYIEGSSNNKAIEIYNGTGSEVNLTGYNLKVYTNGATTPGSAINLSGTLASGATYIVANPNANATILGLDNMTSGLLSHNGNDAIGLFAGTTLIDLVGPIGDSSNWGIDVTLVRKADASVPKTTYSASDWDSYATDTTTYLGMHNFSGGLSKAYVSGYNDLDVGVVTSKSVTGLTSATEYYYVVRAYNSYGTSDDSNEINVATTTSNPLITLSAATLSDFYYVENHGPSAAQSFTVSGENLTANISIVAATNYEISLSSGSGYTSPLTLTQSGGTVGNTTVYVRLKAGLNAGDYNEEVITVSSTGAADKTVTCSGTVEAPLTAAIPYGEDFSSGLTGVYTYSVTGTKPWTIYSGAASGNGYGSSAEEQWMILPGIDFNSYSAERMTFTTNATYGSIDANNYLKLMYSSNYLGLGDPSSATWTELSFANGGVTGVTTPSGVLDLSGISGDMVFIAFKYYSTNSPTRWNVDDISIYLATPLISTVSDLEPFTYMAGSGPSDEQSFTVSGADLTNNIVITAPTNFEISTGTGESFVATSPITLTESSGSVAETPIYVRLKSGLAIGMYNQDITIASTGSTGETISCSGEVIDPTLRVETFVNYPETSTSYNTGTFTGIDGSTWNYVKCAGQIQISGKAVTLGRNQTPLAEVYSGTISGGIGTLSFDYMQTFSTNVSLEVYVDTTLVATVTSSAQQGDVLNSGAIIIDQPGDFVIRFSNPSGGQVTIDNVTWSPAYDIPEDEVVTIGGADFLILGGSANINASGEVPGFTHPTMVPSLSIVLTLIGAGPWDITIETDALYGAYYRNGAWTTVENVNGLIEFNVEAAKDMDLPIILGDSDPNTLPVELSAFTATISSISNAVLTWVTQTETNVNGFYIYRNMENDLNEAILVSPLIHATNSSQQQVYQFTDKNLGEPGTYYYWLQVSDMDGSESYHGPVNVRYEQGGQEAPNVPTITELKNVYPNPFNPSTTISYALSASQNVSFAIFNKRGQLVRTYQMGERAAGNHSFVWNGTDMNGNAVSTGVYFIRMQAGRDSFSKKAVLMK